MLGTTSQLDIFFAYGRTWRRICHSHLMELAARGHSKIRVVLPDPEDGVSIHSMADRFEITPDELKRQIYEAKEFFQSLLAEDASLRENVTVWFRRGTTLFSFYILDKVAVITLYAHTFESFGPTVKSPTLIVSKGGWMFDWLQDEFKRIIQGADGRTRKIDSE